MDSITLNTTKLSKLLSEKTKESSTENKDINQLISLTDDILLVWCPEEVCLYAQTLQKLRNESDDKNTFKIQCLTLSKPPIWSVKRIAINQTGTGVLLIGKEGVAVVELPKRWGNPPLFEGGTDTVVCRVEYVGDQFFSCNTKVHIISADWHPGSVDDKSILVLSSDNYLRMYNLPHVDIPEQAIPVAQSLRSTGETGKIGVGEYAVAFGVGSPLNRDEIEIKYNQNVEQQIDEHRDRFHDLQWPVFILYNNGNIFYTISSLNHRKMKRKILYGPLSMFPSSYDNYGLEFCSLLVLRCCPNVLVIGNSSGFIHHCIVLENSADESQNVSQDLDVTSFSNSMYQLNLETCSMCLHVYESVQVKLTTVKKDHTEDEPMILLADPNTPARYWVMHKEGIQGITLPLVENLLKNGIDFPSYDLECHVEHFVCTRPLEKIEFNSVVGLTISTSPCSIIFLLGSGAVHSMDLPSLFFPNINFTQTKLSEPSSKSKKNHFEEHIRSILQRHCSQPVLLSGSGPPISADDYLALFTQVSDKLRNNYIQPQIKAKEAIERRRNILCDQRKQLNKEVNCIQHDQQLMTEKAHQLAEKYEEANDRNLALMNRLEVVVGHLVRKMPVLSSAEKAMLKELEEMASKSKNFTSELLQINSKYQWQQKQIEKQTKNETLVSQRQSSLSDNQQKQLKTLLSNESDKLSSVVKRINYMKREVGQ